MVPVNAKAQSKESTISCRLTKGEGGLAPAFAGVFRLVNGLSKDPIFPSATKVSKSYLLNNSMST
jgi:hypothetical protein